MADQEMRPVIVTDTSTGKQMIVYQNPKFTGDIQQPLYLDPSLTPAHYPTFPQPLHPATASPLRRRPSRKRRVSERELRRRERKASFAGTWFGLFILSWVPCGLGLPGGTLLAWGLLAAFTLYRACR